MEKFMTRLLIFACVSLIVFSGCSKENLPGQMATSEVNFSTARQPFPVNQSGSITGLLTPAGVRVKITLYDTQRRAYGPFYADPSGNFRITGILAGTYKLVIEVPGNISSEIADATVTGISRLVQVLAGRTTDLGVITLY